MHVCLPPAGERRRAPRALSLLALAALSLSTGAVGCGGGGGGGAEPAPLPTIVSVAPSVAWRDEPTTLTVVGTDTGWSAAAPPLVLAGSDVTVESVLVVSPTTLAVTIRPAYDATTGNRLLWVGAGATLLGSPGYELRAPVAVSFFSQPFARASALVGAAFARREGESVDGAVVAVASNGDLLPLYLDDAHGFIVIVPEDAPLGPFDVLVKVTGPDGTETVRVPAGPIVPRTTVLTTFPASVTLPTADGTALHRFTTTADGLVEFPMTSSDPSLPVHFLYAHESPFAPPVVGLAPILYGTEAAGPRAVAQAGETFDILVFSGHTSYTVSAVQSPAPRVAETEPNDGPDLAQTLALPAMVDPATMDASSGDDWYRVDIGDGDLGKALRVVTSSGPSVTVALFRDDGAVLGGASASGPGSAVDLRTAPLSVTGSVYVAVTSAATPASPDVVPAYRLFLRLEAP